MCRRACMAVASYLWVFQGKFFHFWCPGSRPSFRLTHKHIVVSWANISGRSSVCCQCCDSIKTRVSTASKVKHEYFKCRETCTRPSVKLAWYNGISLARRRDSTKVRDVKTKHIASTIYACLHSLPTYLSNRRASTYAHTTLHVQKIQAPYMTVERGLGPRHPLTKIKIFLNPKPNHETRPCCQRVGRGRQTW
jgi:hypothetical protein